MTTRQYHKFQGQTIEEMHLFSGLCYSRLKFAIDEHQFLTSMLKEKVFVLTESHLYPKAVDLVKGLNKMKQEGNNLLIQLNNHRNRLQVLFENQFDDEWEYKHEHRKVMIKMHEFMGNYEDLKRQVFRILSDAMKMHKQKKLRDSNFSAE